MANTLLNFSGRRSYQDLLISTTNPKWHQDQVLKKILTANKNSEYGKQFSFASIKSASDYHNAVPMTDYDMLIPWIERIKLGISNVLTVEPVLAFEKSSGSTAASKYIPYTRSLKREFQTATSAWINDLLTHRPLLRGLGTYWSISPVAQQREITAGGIPVGFENDTEYFNFIEQWILKHLILIPESVKKIADVTTWRYVTLRLLLNKAHQLGFISIWNPSFLTLLIDTVETEGERLLYDLKKGVLTPPQPLPDDLQKSLSCNLQVAPEMAKKLKTLLQGNHFIVGTDLFPNLQLISCWTSGNSKRFLPELQKRFPEIEIQGKGLLATEGVISIPLLDQIGEIPALNSHYLEFIPENASEKVNPLGIHELDMNKRYSVLLTTGGGLYRYALHDMIEVVGKLRETPLIQFIGKTGKISDIVGEKLNELHISAVIDEISKEHNHSMQFIMLAPELETPFCYYLFLESSSLTIKQLEVLTNQLESKLKQNHHYKYARELGQLGPLKSILVFNGAIQYLKRCISLGQKAGEIKPSVLHTAHGWLHWFTHYQEYA